MLVTIKEMLETYEILHSSFTEWLTRLGYAPATIKSRSRQLGHFLAWLEGQQVRELEQVAQSDIEAYAAYLHTKTGRGGQVIGSRSIEAYLGVLRLLDEYRRSYGAEPLLRSLPKVEATIQTPRRILSVEQIKALYEATDGDEVTGLLQRAVLALYYGCGLRCGEGIRLKIDEIDLKGGLLLVAKSKNHYQRYVPLSAGVVEYLRDWLRFGRRQYAYTQGGWVLLNKRGGAANGSSLNKVLKDLCQKADVPAITLHSLRHSIATHLLADGMDLVAIGRFLGHRSLEATQTYTHLIHE